MTTDNPTTPASTDGSRAQGAADQLAPLTTIEIFWRHDVHGQSEAETLAQLDAIQIRGAFRVDGSFVGYDYANQCWLDEPA